MTLNPVGYTNTLDLFGDSLTAGAGGNGQNLATCLAALYPHRIINNNGIGGQTAQQIAARQGGLPVRLAVTGGSIPAAYSTAGVTPSTQLLSTASDNTTRYLSGTIAGQHVTLIRSATGGPPSTSETYTIMSAGVAAATTPPSWAPFIPDQGWNARDSVQVLWLGRNNVGADVSAVPGLVTQCIGFIHAPQRAVVIGVLPSLTETIGSGSSRTQTDAANAVLAATYGAAFVPSTPPTTAEMTAVGYSPTTQDNTDIANGVWPSGLRADNVHLTGPAYNIFALRVQQVLESAGW